MQELIKIQSAPAKLEVNFGVLQAALKKELARYEVVVTADTLADAKKLATDLNKTKAAIADRRKAEVAKASEPIKAFDERMKELEGMCEEGRGKILAQVKRFEDETREQAREALHAERFRLWAEMRVTPEFQRAEYDDLILVSSVTAKGNLTAKAKDELASRVTEDRLMQDQTERRLLELENASYKAGLSAPLTKDHIRPFLFADHETYDRELTRILEAEVRRQEQAEAAMRERLEKEARQKAEAEQRERERVEARLKAEKDLAEAVLQERMELAEKRVADALERERQQREAAQKAAESVQEAEPEEEQAPDFQEGTRWEPDPAPPGKITLTVVAVFRPEVDPSVTNEAVEKALRDAMLKAGIKTLQEITIHRPQTRAAA